MIVGGTIARSYGPAHKTERRRWAPLVAAGQVWCAKCGKWIQPGILWDLGHTDDRTGYTGPEHRACNRRAAARKVNAVRRRQAQLRQSMWTRW